MPASAARPALRATSLSAKLLMVVRLRGRPPPGSACAGSAAAP
jgi:hypothetical protein